MSKRSSLIGSEKSQDETAVAEHSAIDRARFLFSESRIFPPQTQQVAMQIVKMTVLLALREIEFALCENAPGRLDRGDAPGLPRFAWTGTGAEIQNALCESPRSNLFDNIREINKRTRSAEFLSLKKQWRPRPKKKQRCHGAISAGRCAKANALARDRDSKPGRDFRGKKQMPPGGIPEGRRAA